jgi:hypothetical protein
MGHRTRKRKPPHRKRTLHRNMRGGKLNMKTLLQATVLFAKKNGIEYGVPLGATAPTSQSKSATTNKYLESKQTEYYTDYYLLLRMSMKYADIVEINKVKFDNTPGFAESIVVPFNELFHKVESGGSTTKVDFTIDVIFNDDKQTSTQRNLAKSIKDNLISNNFQKVVDDCATLKPSVPENFKSVIDIISVLASVAEFIKTHPIDQKLMLKAKEKNIGEQKQTKLDEQIPIAIEKLNKLSAELTTIGKKVNVLKTSDTSRVNPETDALVEQISADLKEPRKQLTHVLPYFLQIYEKLYSNAMDQKIEVNKHPVSTRLIQEFVTRKIRDIEANHPHPELFDTMYYYWGLFDLSISLQFLDYYINTVYDALNTNDTPGQIMTVVEKQLSDAGSFPEWDSDNTKARGYKIYSKAVGQKRNPIKNANSDILALTSNPFKPYNPIINTFNTMLETTDDGALSVIKNEAPDILPLNPETTK